MNKMKKFALIAVCAALLVCVTVGATVAWLTSTAKVENTFTVGKVAITLDEAKVNPDGSYPEGTQRVNGNEYHLLPGQGYPKDPTVHVEANSEDSYIFVKVTSDINAIIETRGNYSIETQILSNGWTKLDGVDGVYYKEYKKNTALVDYLVFSQFKVKDDVNGTQLAAYAPVKTDNGTVYKTITVTAYAIQKTGFNDAKDAWTKSGFGA